MKEPVREEKELVESRFSTEWGPGERTIVPDRNKDGTVAPRRTTVQSGVEEKASGVPVFRRRVDMGLN